MDNHIFVLEGFGMMDAICSVPAKKKAEGRKAYLTIPAVGIGAIKPDHGFHGLARGTRIASWVYRFFRKVNLTKSTRIVVSLFAVDRSISTANKDMDRVAGVRSHEIDMSDFLSD